MTTPFRTYASKVVTDADDPWAVIIEHGQVTLHLTIAQARELSLALAVAADEAELKLG